MRDKGESSGLGEKYGLVILSEAKNQFGLRAFYSSCVVRLAQGPHPAWCVVSRPECTEVD